MRPCGAGSARVREAQRLLRDGGDVRDRAALVGLREPEQPLEHVGAAPRRFLERDEALAQRIALGAREQELGLAEQGREDAVELAGEPRAEGGHHAGPLLAQLPGVPRLAVAERLARLPELVLRLQRRRDQGRQHQRGLHLFRGEVPRLRVGHTQEPHHATPRAHRHQQDRAESFLLEQAGPGAPSRLKIADRHRPVGREALREQPIGRADAFAPDAGEQARAREHAHVAGAVAREGQGPAHARDPARGVRAAGQDLARLARGEVGVHQAAQLAQVRDQIAAALEQPLMHQRGADPVGDDQEQEHVGRGERRAELVPAREEHPAHLALRPHRDRDALPHREALDERVGRGRVAGGVVGQHALLGEDAPDQPLARVERHALQVVPPEAAARAGHEAAAGAVQDEQQRAVGGQQPGDPVHRQPEQLAGREPEGRNRQDLLEDVEGVLVPGRVRPVPEALPEILEDVAELGERGANGVAGHQARLQLGDGAVTSRRACGCTGRRPSGRSRTGGATRAWLPARW